jgi:hypothetical protein
MCQFQIYAKRLKVQQLNMWMYNVHDLIKISMKEVGRLFVKYKIHSLWKIKNFITVLDYTLLLELI